MVAADDVHASVFGTPPLVPPADPLLPPWPDLPPLPPEVPPAPFVELPLQATSTSDDRRAATVKAARGWVISMSPKVKWRTQNV
jgi:hypothetical protein